MKPPATGDGSVGACLRLASEQLAETGSGRLDAELLLAHVLGWTRTEIHTRILETVSQSLRKDFWRLVSDRKRGVPVAYLVGWKEFYSRRFWVGPGVLVPRPETELLVEKGLELLKQTPGPTRVLDLCCGSGCIAITIALETLTGMVWATDVDAAALTQTQENIEFFGLQERVKVLESDLFSDLQGERFDLILSNPPYVGTDFGPRPDHNVAAHEPAHALYSGPAGTDHLEPIVERAPAHLIEGGSLVLECASFQVERVEAWMNSRGFAQTQLWHDLSGLPRGVSGRWEGQS